MTGAQWSTRQALYVIFGSTLATLFLSFGLYAAFNYWKTNRTTAPQYQITSIIQTGPQREALKTVYLAELLGLSIDAPKNLYSLDLRSGEKALLSSPLIKDAHLQRIAPTTLYIDYEVRQPIAWLADYRNTAIDKDGYLFPVDPFLSPKEITEIYLGLPPFGAPEDSYGRTGGHWRLPLQNRYLTLALNILQTFEGSPWKEGLRIERIDVSNAFAPTLGRREIVLVTEEELSLPDRHLTFIFPKILRLAPRDYAQQLNNFFALRRSMVDDYRKQLSQETQGSRFAPRIIDLRIQQLAFIENHK